MRRLYAILIIALCAIASMLPARQVSAATNMGAGVLCHGTPTYGTNPRITCTMTATRHASWLVHYSNGCISVRWGDAFKWSNGVVNVNTRGAYLVC